MSVVEPLDDQAAPQEITFEGASHSMNLGRCCVMRDDTDQTPPAVREGYSTDIVASLQARLDIAEREIKKLQDSQASILAHIEVVQIGLPADYTTKPKDSQSVTVCLAASGEPTDEEQAAKETLDMPQLDEEDRNNVSGAVAELTDSHLTLSKGWKTLQAHKEYCWEDSVYDSMFLIFAECVTIPQSLLLLFGMCANLVMVIITVLILGSPEFISRPFADVDVFRNWRYTDAHAYMNADPYTQAALGARVCNKDRSLSIATQQMQIVYEVDKYMESSQGFLLCTVAVTLWACCCAQELRSAFNFSLAVLNLPSAHHLVICVDEDDFNIDGVSRLRRSWGCAIALLRAAFAGVLAVYGSIWLAYTTSIENLLLNASALGFILDIDNTVFSIVSPLEVVALINGLKPGKMPHSKYLVLVPYALMLGLTGFTIFINASFTANLVSDMRETHKALCEPVESLNYVLGMNHLGLVSFAKAPAKHIVDSDRPQFQYIKLFATNPEQAERYGFEMSSVDHVRGTASMSVYTFVNEYKCNDNNSLEPGAAATVGSRLVSVTSNQSFASITNCAQAKPYCLYMDASGESSTTSPAALVGINVRFMCPETCGCSEVYSGLWDVATPGWGCPQQACKKRLLNQLKVHPGRHVPIECKDRPVIKDAGWRFMISRWRILQEIGEEAHSNLTIHGCDALRYLPSWQVMDLCSMNVLSVNHGAAPFCPVSCQCSTAESLGAREKCPGLCPKKCCAR